MRGELAIRTIPPNAGEAAKHDAWPIIGFCFIALAMSIYFSISSMSLDQISLLIIQYNLF
jgi:hypothetical protein